MRAVNRIINTGILTWIIGLIVWQLLSLASSPDFLPGPYQTLLGAIELSKDGSLWQYMGASLFRVAVGWSLGSLIAIPVGLIMGRVTVIRRLTEPFLNFIRFIPPLAFITLFMLWFGIGEQSKIILILYSTLFIVILNTMTGVLSIEEDKIRSARSMGATEWQTMLHVIIPATVPYMFTGVRLAMSTSYMAIIGAEMIAADKGVGFMIWNARLYFKMDWIFVGLFALGLMGYFTDRLLNWFGSTVLARYGIAGGTAFRGRLR
ncbi:binding-protein-dependent transport systems inner membrane component [Paenibacillus mucilaginosus 3016]|uniref:Binding-protein-dependent transport systems inner membrane component n=2 Tax=Paenibacillus mucilaginosus TaxID=61624 RepID=H6NPX1_9BACL|nr:ABC transporter permease [Paenibacillus mucilaginosus]AFC31162.1 binding-protein-dependent transport systems inner membrane component [Paenibacillus mucilaginosus 3016]AFH63483.1 nitrate ABC transporter permease [Paenibacillus mucilaginosus K02]WFA19739.1 ABC transporter permease [Paenibacillus mucilaginosus]